MSRLKEIHDYLVSLGRSEEDLEQLDTSSVYLCMEIMEYAHRNQTRENGEDYACHPMRCLRRYRDMVGIDPDDYFCIDKDMMYEHNVPFDGVQEVCLLHDVIEDSDFTIDDIEELFIEQNLGDYFDTYIRSPLELITHDKSMPYLDYIKICMKHPTSALVKMIDLDDNTNVLTYDHLDKERLNRTLEFITYIALMDKGYNFIKNIREYREEFNGNK